MPILLRALPGFAIVLCLTPVAAWSASSQEEAWETQVGRQQYMEYAQRGEVVPPQSPVYRSLGPVGHAVAAVADRDYYAPFHFIVLNEQTPNAFSMPGGNVYVTTGMLSLLKNRDELAGVLCHEVSHDIHHDTYAVFQASRGQSPYASNTISYERAAETNADRTGAYICAKAGFNPWGMIWNFRQYRQTMGVSNNGGVDHPSDERREANLVALFQNDRATFGKFHDSVASAAPLGLPQIAQRQYSPYPHSPNPQYPSYQQYTQRYMPYPQQYPQYPQQYMPYPQSPQQSPQYQQQYPPQQYPPQQYPPQQYPPQQYPPQQYPPQQYPPQQYPPQQYPPRQYPPQQYPPQQYPPQQYPPPGPPSCYPGC